jgi:hypothetical protein
MHADMSMNMFMDTVLVFITAWMRVHASTVHHVHTCPRMFTERVHVGRSADKLGLIDEAIGGGADLALIDELIERGPGDAELAGGLYFGELGHGKALASAIMHERFQC